MKTTLFKWLLIIAALLFADWVIMAVIGCISGICHAGNQYFCTVYCFTGISLLAATGVVIACLIYRKDVQRDKQTI